MTRTVTMCGIALVACALTSGCASIITRSAGDVNEFYIGAKTDCAILGESGKGDFGAYTSGLAPLALLDLPLSIVVDTVLLPVDVFLVTRKGR